MIGRDRKDALVKLRREQLAGRIHSAGEITLITRGERAGQYAIPVYLIIAPRPRRTRRMPRWVPALVAAVLAPVVLLGMLFWVLTTLTTVSLTLLLVTVLVGFLGWVRARHGRSGGRSATVTTTVTFH